MSFFSNSSSNNNNSNRGHRRNGGGNNNGGDGYNNGYNSFASRLGGNGGNGGNDNGQSLTRIEIRNWQGGSRDNLVEFIFKKSKIRLQDTQVTGAVFRARVSSNDASVLVNLNGIRFAGSALNIRAVEENSNNDGFNRSSSGNRNTSRGYSKETKNTIQLLEEYLNDHFNPEIKLLNLENMVNDPFLISHNLLSAESQAKMFAALMKLASNNFPVVESVSLANNGLSDLQAVTTVAATYPDLKNLSLANNNFINVSSLNLWRNKFPNLRELILSGNPISATPGYKNDLIRMFPSLIVLDGQVVQDESQLNTVKYPIQIQHNFSENNEVGSIAANFLATFLELYDRDRSQLLPLYDDQSTFTVALNLTALRQLGGPGNSGSRTVSANDRSDYIPLSRNMCKITSANSRVTRLNIGQQAIAAVFQKLPPTQHDLKSPEKFAVDVWSLKGIRAVDDQAIMIFVHGEYLENNTPYSFDRSLVILPGPNGNMIVSSDMLTIRPYSGNDGWKPFHTLGSNSNSGAANGAPMGNIPSGPASMAGSAPLNTPSSAPASASSMIDPQILQNLSSSQQLVLKTLVEKTKLTAQYAMMCAQQANFDLQQSLQLFEQSKTQLPPDAFMS